MSENKVSRFALRLDVPADPEARLRFKGQVDTWLLQNCKAWILALESHEGENPHAHAILDSSKKIKDLRNTLVYALGFGAKGSRHGGNAAYSLKACTDDPTDYLRYICKGESEAEGPRIWSRQGLEYGEEAIREAHANYWVTNAALKENSAKRRKLAATTTVEALEKLCKQKGYKGFDRVSVANEYISMYCAARKPINLYAARAVVNTVCCLLDLGDQAKASLASRIADI